MIKDFTQILSIDLFRQFFGAWQKLRVADALPTRKSVTLRDFAPFAADLVIYEMPKPGFLQCRLMGSQVSDRVRVDNTNLNWFDFIAPDMSEASKTWWGNLFSTPCAGAIQFSTGLANGSSRISQALLLPVTVGPDQVHLIGLISASTVYATGAPRDSIILSQDCFLTKYIDVGMGVPAGLPEVAHHKKLDSAVAATIFPE